jgi:O-antigen/teichoic acid export membrane protein
MTDPTVAPEPPVTEPTQESPHHALRLATIAGLRWATMARTVVELMLTASLVVLARLISPAGFGAYAIAAIVQALAIGIQEQGVASALVQRPTITHAHLQVGGALALASGVVLAALTLLLAPLLMQPLFGDQTANLIALSAPLFVLYAVGIVPYARMRRDLNFKRMSMIDMLNTFVRVSVAVALAVSGMGAKALVFGALAGATAQSLAAFISAPAPFPRMHRREMRDLLGYGVSASLASITWVCFANCDYVIVGARIGAAQAGLYFRAYNLAIEYQSKISDLLTTVAFPVLARTSDPDELNELRRRMVRLLTLVVFPLLTLLAVGAPVLIPWLLGDAWQGAVVPTQILTLGGMATLLINATGVVLMSKGRSRAMLGFGTAHFLVYAAAVWLTCSHGITAVAIAACVVHTSFMFVSYSIMLYQSPAHPLRTLWKDASPAVITCLALAAAADAVRIALSAADVPAFAELLLLGAAGGIVYLGVLRLAFPNANSELWSGLGRILPVKRLLRFRRPPLAAARSVG